MRIFLHLLFIVFLSGNAFAQEKDGVDVRTFKKGIRKERPVVLDVRRPEEYGEGHLKNAVNFNWLNPDEFSTIAARLQKTKPVYLYCRTGVRSSKAAEWLRSNGFTQVVELEGGIKAWLDAGKPVVK